MLMSNGGSVLVTFLGLVLRFVTAFGRSIEWIMEAVDDIVQGLTNIIPIWKGYWRKTND